METSEKVAYWLDVAQYDLETAQAMDRSGRYLYTAFMCQQAIEKVLKALHLQTFEQEAPHSHNLPYLAGLLQLELSEDHVRLLARLSAYYIEGRYPTYRQKLSQLLDAETSQVVLKQTGDVFTWLYSKVK